VAGEDSHEYAEMEVQELRSPSWLGCLPKLCVYDPGLGLTGRVLVFDLDSIICGDLDPFFEAIRPGVLITRAWFAGLRRGIWASGGDLLGFESPWDRGAQLFSRFQENTPEYETNISEGGRERFVYRKLLGGTEEIDYWQRVAPRRIVSYKWHCRGTRQPPSGAAVVSCHGHPRPHKIREEWLKQCWA
jgi:hypothetical protein